MHEKQDNKCRFDNGNSQGNGSAHHTQILTGGEPSHYRQDAQGKKVGPIRPGRGGGMQRHQRSPESVLPFSARHSGGHRAGTKGDTRRSKPSRQSASTGLQIPPERNN